MDLELNLSSVNPKSRKTNSMVKERFWILNKTHLEQFSAIVSNLFAYIIMGLNPL